MRANLEPAHCSGVVMFSFPLCRLSQVVELWMPSTVATKVVSTTKLWGLSKKYFKAVIIKMNGANLYEPLRENQVVSSSSFGKDPGARKTGQLGLSQEIMRRMTRQQSCCSKSVKQENREEGSAGTVLHPPELVTLVSSPFGGWRLREMRDGSKNTYRTWWPCRRKTQRIRPHDDDEARNEEKETSGYRCLETPETSTIRPEERKKSSSNSCQAVGVPCHTSRAPHILWLYSPRGEIWSRSATCQNPSRATKEPQLRVI